MERIHDITRINREERSVVTVGTFDGVHLGHRAIFDYLIARAQEESVLSTLVTFDPHPREIVYGESVPLLTTMEEKAAICERIGIDRFVVVRFTETFSELSPESFIREVLVDRLGIQKIVVGHDHGFGKGRSGDDALLLSLSITHDFSVDVIPSVLLPEGKVSSSAIRKLIANEGDVKSGARMLGYYYGFESRVIRGLGRGRIIGFPTANLQPDDPHKIIPAMGVYAVFVSVEGHSSRLDGMMNIGTRPTFEDTGRHIEVHILDFDMDIYGRQLRLEFVDRIRSERMFDGVDALARQLNDDKRRCSAALREQP